VVTAQPLRSERNGGASVRTNVPLGSTLSRSSFHLPEWCRSFLNLATTVPCQATSQSQYCPHRRPGGFEDPISNHQQFLLRWWAISPVGSSFSLTQLNRLCIHPHGPQRFGDHGFPGHPLSLVLISLQIHNTGFFLPWHRQYVQTFEDKLKSECGYNGVQPYWDWTQGNPLS
jgi:hypothetical protein